MIEIFAISSFIHSQITIPIAQFVERANESKAILVFYKIADFLMLIHFASDPYIYVLLRTNYWLRFKNFVKQLLCKKNEKAEFAEFSELPKTETDHF
jgi:hypothetical protein